MTRASLHATGRQVWVAAGIVTAAALVLLAMGREPWCTCGVIRLWTGDATGPQNSQQLLDPYSFTHVTHGVLIYVLLRVLAGRRPLGTRMVLMVALESLWEIIENTNAVIDHYRAATLALGYYGDSVLNSIGDIAMCVVGFSLAAHCRPRTTAALTIGLELLLLIWIRDNLALNVLMLLSPIEAVRQWQLGP